MEDWALPYAYDFIPVKCGNSTDPGTIISLLDQYTQNKRSELNQPDWAFDGICSFDEYSIVCASQVAAHYGKPCIKPDIVAKIKHKYRLRLESEQVCFLYY